MMSANLLEMRAKKYEREGLVQLRKYRLLQPNGKKKRQHKDDPYVRYRILLQERKASLRVRSRLCLTVGRVLVRIGRRLISASGSSLYRMRIAARPPNKTFSNNPK